MIEIERHGEANACVARISGDLDSVTVVDVRQALDRAINSGCSTIVLDLEKVAYLDSSALGLLVWVDRRLQPRGGKLVLAGAGRDVSRILELSGLIGVAPSVTSSESVDDAMSGLSVLDHTARPLWTETFKAVAQLSGLAEMRNRVVEMLGPLELTEATLFDMKVAAGEALANAVKHGSPRGAEDDVDVEVSAYDERVDVLVSDRGAGFAGVIPVQEDVYASGGRGIVFMRALMDAVEYLPRDGGGTTVRLVKRRTAADGRD